MVLFDVAPQVVAPSPPPGNGAAREAYIRQIAMRFVTEGDRGRTALLPVMLDLLGCTEKQVAVAVAVALRQWRRTSHWVTTLLDW
jgi:hypothetical protein